MIENMRFTLKYLILNVLWEKKLILIEELIIDLG